MKQLATLLICLTLFVNAQAQQQDNNSTGKRKKEKHNKDYKSLPPACYIGFSMGTNNPAGIIGLDVNIPLTQVVTLDGGAGTSTWGNKLYVGSKYYLRSPQRGWAFGGGLTFNSGIENFKHNLETRNGSREKVTLSLKPQTNIYLGIYHYWSLGRNQNRFYMNFGWSVSPGGVRYKQLNGPQISDRSHRLIDALSPGGFVAGLGFSFALYNRHTNMYAPQGGKK